MAIGAGVVTLSLDSQLMNYREAADCIWTQAAGLRSGSDALWWLTYRGTEMPIKPALPVAPLAWDTPAFHGRGARSKAPNDSRW